MFVINEYKAQIGIFIGILIDRKIFKFLCITQQEKPSNTVENYVEQLFVLVFAL